MKELERRTFLKAAFAAATLTPDIFFPCISESKGVDAIDVGIANWVKRGGDKTIEELVIFDSGRKDYKVGSVAVYIREVEINDDRICVTYIDGGPPSKKSGLVYPDGIPNKYDVLKIESCDDPSEQRSPMEEKVEFVDWGLNGALHNGQIKNQIFWNPASEEFKKELTMYDSNKTKTPQQNHQLKMKYIESNRLLFSEAQQMYNELIQELAKISRISFSHR